MTSISLKMEQISDSIRENFKTRDAAREKSLPVSREAIRYCSLAIRAVHRQELAQAREMLVSAKALIKEAGQAIDACGELSNTAFFLDAQKEYAEANTVLALVDGKDMPSPQELEVDNAAYLNGIGEAAGELRRYILDGLRKGEDTRGEELLQAMDDIYEVLVTMDFPDAITGGLRRTTDMVRGVLERTRSDLTLYIQQKGLEQKLEDFQSKLTRKGE
ncbi:MAG: haloacid dehalogenase [Dehalococcoides mccartyi]|uniref:Haloacid dehalogenase n=2 Tax=Dehalococcoides mccartyi TaxID=61435 RepID=A0A0V8LY16_9CHLR|nr:MULTISPECIES: haloacid dehalogenase [Dehalococcoides]KSV16414.1 haloacid dehalogenase [Dehalococcoides mccartyi]MBF4482892.1 haloacid dehalogenase [Dehalococcoides mccartyi]MBJ7532108.1 haloacid dehalogenase [Dehalococcoides mccartyi]MDP4280104.1 haloacid dehalogenase [Dehalococcoides mccartyi]OBW61938.1 MAG: haloacid dehalogenase [Dehalococcoides mccartyi]